jgi:hypothetical protein
MKKIIRVTESELVKMIGKVINEQANVAPYYNFRTGQMAGTAAPPPQPGPAMDPKGDPTKFTQKASPNIGCVGLKSPETNKTITGINGDTIQFFNNGRFADVKGQKGNYVCGQYPNIINLMYDSDPTAVKYFNMTPKPVAQQQQTKTVFAANEKFPLKFQQKGEAIKKIQTALGVKPTGQFWTVTEKAVLAKAPEYKRATGVTQDIYNKIVGAQTTVNPDTAQQNLFQGGKNLGKQLDRLRNQNTQTPEQIAFNNSLRTGQ